MSSNEEPTMNETSESRDPAQGEAVSNEVPTISARKTLEKSKSMPQLQEPHTRPGRVISQEELDFVESLKERSITPAQHEVRKFGEVKIVRTLSRLVGSDLSFVDEDEDGMAGYGVEEKKEMSFAGDNMEHSSTIGTDTHLDDEVPRPVSSADVLIAERVKKKWSRTGRSEEATTAQKGQNELVGDTPKEALVEPSGETAEFSMGVNKTKQEISLPEPTYPETAPILTEYDGAPEEVPKAPESQVTCEDAALAQPPDLQFKPPEQLDIVEPSYTTEPAPAPPAYEAPEEPTVAEPSYTAEIAPVPPIYDGAAEPAGEVQAPSVDKQATGTSIGEPTYAETTPLVEEYAGPPEEVFKSQESLIKAEEEPPAADASYTTEAAPAPPASEAPGEPAGVEPPYTTEAAPASLATEALEEPTAVEKSYTTEPAPVPLAPEAPGELVAVEPSHITELVPASPDGKPSEEAVALEPSSSTEPAPPALPYEQPEELAAAEPSYTTEPAPVPLAPEAPGELVAVESSHITELVPAAPDGKPPEEVVALEPSSATEPAPPALAYEQPEEPAAAEPSHTTEPAPASLAPEVPEEPAAVDSSETTETAPVLSDFIGAEEPPAVEASYTAEPAPAPSAYEAPGERITPADKTADQVPSEAPSPPLWYESPSDPGASESSSLQPAPLGAVHDGVHKQDRKDIETSVEFEPCEENLKQPSSMKTMPILVHEGTPKEGAIVLEASLQQFTAKELPAGEQPSKETIGESAPGFLNEHLVISVLKPRHDEPFRVLAGMPAITEPTKMDHPGAEERTLFISAPGAPPRSFAEDTEVPKVSLAWDAELSKPSVSDYKIQRLHNKMVAKMSIVLRDGEPVVTSNTSSALELAKDHNSSKELVLEYVACEEQVLEGVSALDGAESDGLVPSSGYDGAASHTILAPAAVEDCAPNFVKEKVEDNPLDNVRPDAE